MRIFLTIAALIYFNNCWAQQFHFSGKISGLADEDLTVEYPSDRFGNTWKEQIPVSNRSFQREIELPASGWMKVSYKDKDRSFYVWKGSSSLALDFEADFLDSDINLTGDGSDINRFATQINEKFGSKFSVKWVEEQAKNASNIDGMEMEFFAFRNDILHALDKTEADLSSEFVNAYKNHVTYYYYLALFKYSAVKSARSSIPKATEIPKVLMEGLSWDRMNRTSELDSEFFRELLLEFVDYKALEAYDFMKFATKGAAVQEAFNLARENLKGESLQYFLTKTALSSSANIQPSLLRQMRDYLATTENAEPFIKLFEDSLAKRLAAKDDEVAVAISNEENDHDVIDMELQGLDGKMFRLSELKGKVVYLDIWASWCGPCRKEFPASKELKAKLSKKEMKNIEFLYISIDNTETVWKLAIEELGIEGVHGLSKGGWGSEATAKFGVRSIPRYLIFDKKGKVIDGNAPRASDPRLLEILQKLAAQ